MDPDQRKSMTAARQDPLFKKIAGWVERAFPGTQADVALVALMMEGLRASEADFIRSLEQFMAAPIASITPDPDSPEAAGDTTPGDYVTYQIEATHLRMTPIYSCFTGIVKAVRVSLHQTSRLPFFTHYGVIWNHDHLVFTVQDVRAWIAESHPDFMAFERVDLVTPARHDLVRFAPVAVYLGYEKHDSPQPSFYLLESGLATGQPAVLYLAETMDHVIDQSTGYMPTPWSKPSNVYTGKLAMHEVNGQQEPDVLTIESREKANGRPYICITLDYRTEAEPGDIIFPGRQTLEAALRIASIAEGMGCELPLIDQWFAKHGLDRYAWNLSPVPEATSD